MNNGKFEKTTKDFRGKSYLKNNPVNKFQNHIFKENYTNNTKSNSKKHYFVINNKGLKSNHNLLIENNNDADDNKNYMNLFSEFKIEESLKSRPPTQRYIKKTPSPTIFSSNPINNLNDNKIDDNIKKEKANNYLKKLNKKNLTSNNPKIINDLIPFNDIYQKKKHFIKSNNNNNNVKIIKSGKMKFIEKDNDMNFFVNYDEIFDLKKKVSYYILYFFLL